MAEIGETSAVKESLARRYVHVGLVAEFLESNFVAQGVLTTKGRTRAAVSLYLTVVDRQVRLAGLLGLERQAKPVHPAVALEAAVAEVNRA